jgi:hypothetical protein
VLVLAGAWLTLMSVGAWVLEHAMPRGAMVTLAHALLTVAGELVVRAWPLGLMALGATLLVHGALAPRWALARGRDGR